MKLKTTLQSLLASALLCSGVAMAHAQDRNPPPRRNPPAVDRAPRVRGPGPLAGPRGPLWNELTEQQRASLREVMSKQRTRLRELDMKLRAARRRLIEAGLDQRFKEGAVRKQAMAVARLEAEVSVLRLKALSQIRPPLSPRQINRIKNAPPMRPPRPPGPPPEARDLPRDGRPPLANPNRDRNDLPPEQ